VTDDDIQLIHSPLTQTYSADGHTLQIEIYRGAGSLWILEIVDELAHPACGMSSSRPTPPRWRRLSGH
jgi:hypothetical protein